MGKKGSGIGFYVAVLSIGIVAIIGLDYTVLKRKLGISDFICRMSKNRVLCGSSVTPTPVDPSTYVNTDPNYSREAAEQRNLAREQEVAAMEPDTLNPGEREARGLYARLRARRAARRRFYH